MLKLYGDAIYGTRVCAPYKKGNIAFTQKDGKVYALELFPEESSPVPEEVFLPWEGEVKKVSLLDCGKEVPFTAGEGGILVKMPSFEEETVPIARVYVLHR